VITYDRTVVSVSFLKTNGVLDVFVTLFGFNTESGYDGNTPQKCHIIIQYQILFQVVLAQKM